MDLSKAYEDLKGYYECFDSAVAEMDSMLQNLDKEIELLDDPDYKVAKSNKLEGELTLLGTKVENYTKIFATPLSIMTKGLDKNFYLDVRLASDPKTFQDQEPIIKQIIIEHFIRQGQFDLAHQFSQEANIEFPITLSQMFQDMFAILSDIHGRNLLPAIRWAQHNRETLLRNGSHLELHLHKLHLYSLLTSSRNDSNVNGSQLALAYASENFGPLLETHPNEIQRLLGILNFSNRRDLSTTPYADFPKECEDAWPEIHFLFTRDFCSVLGLSHESPLYVSVTVGTGALPVLVKMTAIMQKSGNEWSQSQELPVEIELVDTMRFHSTFICPVSKEPGTPSNPPMMMPCGHVICQESLNKLSRGGQTFKCPYCPSESFASQALQIHF